MGFIVPFFIPHMGCPHTCLFCNQHGITGKKELSQGKSLEEEIKTWLGRKQEGQAAQLAFYGGSFTCLPEEVQYKYLEGAKPYLETGRLDSIRISTRPDCIDEQLCDFLKEYGVETIELGLQSMDENVLTLSERGHTSNDSRNAIKILKEKGFTVGVQLLPGLPKETSYTFIKGVKEVISLKPDLVRLYPALVVRRSGLEKLFQEKKYQPLSLNKAICWTARAKELFEKSGVTVIRIGLQQSTDLEQTYVAGPHHPAMGELVESRRWFKRIRKIVSSCPAEKKVVVHISEKDLSAVVGAKRRNIKRLQQLKLQEKLVLKPEKNMERGRVEYAFCE